MADDPSFEGPSPTAPFLSTHSAEATPFANCEFGFAEEFGNLVGAVPIAYYLLASEFRQSLFDLVEFGQ